VAKWRGENKRRRESNGGKMALAWQPSAHGMANWRQHRKWHGMAVNGSAGDMVRCAGGMLA
jgi:hypothetical protein